MHIQYNSGIPENGLPNYTNHNDVNFSKQLFSSGVVVSLFRTKFELKIIVCVIVFNKFVLIIF